MDSLSNNIKNANKFKNVIILENLKMLKNELATIGSVEKEVDELSVKIENLDSILQEKLYSKTENDLAIKHNLLVLKLETIAQLKQNLYDFGLEDADIEDLLKSIKINEP